MSGRFAWARCRRCATPRYHELTTGEQQRRAIRLVEPHSDCCKLVLIVEGKRQHLVDLVQVQRFL